MTIPSPRTNAALFGHEEAELRFLREAAAGTLAHGWIIGGPQGIGKATLAYRFTRALLAPDGDEPAIRRIAAAAHTDLLVVEPEYDGKKEEFEREIKIDRARQIGQFLALTPAEGKWRVVIVDAVDQLNVNAANAILKVLEEPPAHTVLLLISHAPGRLLPTLRSRCRLLRLSPLSDKDFTAAIRHMAPQIDGKELQALAQLSGHAPGLALSLHAQGGLELYRRMLALASGLPKIDTLTLHGFANEIGTGAVHSNWQLFSRLMLCLLERISLQAARAGINPMSDEEGRVLRQLAAFHPAPAWAEKWQLAQAEFSLAEARHLDYKQVIITFFHSLAEKEVSSAGASG